MFTPPPSPLPSRRSQTSPLNLEITDFSCTHTMPSASPIRSRRELNLTLRWTIILVPIILITIAVTAPFIAHPVVFDLFSPSSTSGWKSWSKSLTDWSLHERHKPAKLTLPPIVLSDTSSFPFIKRSTPSATPAPTVPANPTLPTPFPQPYDTTLSLNFSTISCYNFFLNMTQTDSLRSCRPFSLLLTHSQAFIKAQDDIDAMNTDIWGTCNTDISQNQCQLNLAWFASSLRSSCASDLSDQNTMAVNALIGLQAFGLMREGACSLDPVADAYCFVEAVGNSDPSSYYFYQLPLGLPLPKITNGACNSCTKSLMSMYAAALNSANATSLSGLQATYGDAANELNTECGSTYAQTTTVATASSRALPTVRLTSVGGTWAVMLGVGVLWTLMW